jgi:hypothetical protein
MTEELALHSVHCRDKWPCAPFTVWLQHFQYNPLLDPTVQNTTTTIGPSSYNSISKRGECVAIATETIGEARSILLDASLGEERPKTEIVYCVCSLAIFRKKFSALGRRLYPLAKVSAESGGGGTAKSL